MKANAERIEKNTVLLEVEVDADQLAKAMNSAYKSLVKKVNIPGFRKGKAPRVVLERFIGKQALIDEAVEIVVPDAYVKAVEDTGVEPVSQPELELVQVEEGKPFIFKAKVVVKPEVKLGQYTGLEVTRPVAEVNENDVQQELELLQNRYAKLITIDEGQAQKGDLIGIDFLGKIDGTPFEGGQAEDYALELGSQTFIAGFEEQVEGMAINETKDIQVKFPDDYAKEDLAGKDAVFTVTLKSIRRKEVSPLDDEFAKDVSEFDTLEELKADLRNKLKQAAEERVKSEMRQQAVDKAVENAEVELPPEMIDRQVEDMLHTMERRLSSQGLTMESYLKYTDSNLAETKEKFRPDAEQSLKNMLVIDAISKSENFTVSEEEIEAEIEKMGKQMQQDTAVLRKILEGQGQLDMLTESLMREKVLQFLVDKANIVEGTNEAGQE